MSQRYEKLSSLLTIAYRLTLLPSDPSAVRFISQAGKGCLDKYTLPLLSLLLVYLDFLDTRSAIGKLFQ